MKVSENDHHTSLIITKEKRLIIHGLNDLNYLIKLNVGDINKHTSLLITKEKSFMIHGLNKLNYLIKVTSTNAQAY